MMKYPKNHIIVGDININLLQNCNLTTDYKNHLSLHCFKICNTISEDYPTRETVNSSSIIDHVLNDINSNLVHALDIQYNPLSDHNRLLFEISQPNIKEYVPKVSFNLKIINYINSLYINLVTISRI